MQDKSKAAFAQDSIIDVISKTQVSMNIPKILFCSLQCGLAEGDKVANAFSNTLASPEEFMALSLFTFCIQSIQTQVIDSQNRSAAIFMIDKIESQFCRLYENEAKDKLVLNESNTSSYDTSTNNNNNTANNNKTQNKSKAIKLSCISNRHSKTSIRCFRENKQPQAMMKTYGNNDRFDVIKTSIMYECAFENISIKAVKRLNDQEKLDVPPTPDISEGNYILIM